MTTLGDEHGERYDKQFLDDMASSFGERRPLHLHHDMAKGTLGSLSNCRVVPIDDSPGNWKLILDIELPESSLEDPDLRGYSWSSTVRLSSNSERAGVILYLPYPYYGNQTLITEYLEQEHPVAVGKWLKKGLDPFTLALLGNLAAWFLKPVWDSVWKEELYPRIKAQLPAIRRLWQQGIATDLIEQVKLNQAQEKRTNIYLVTERCDPGDSFSESALDAAMKLANDRLVALSSDQRKVRTAKLLWIAATGKYELLEIEFENGDVIRFPTAGRTSEDEPS